MSSRTKYFKVIRGYGNEDYISISEKELEKAYYCFLEKKDSVFDEGAIRGSSIIAIQPDYNRTMGWNRGYKLGPDDYEDLRIKGVDVELRRTLELAQEKMNYVLENKMEYIPGQNVQLPKSDVQVDPNIFKLN